MTQMNNGEQAKTVEMIQTDKQQVSACLSDAEKHEINHLLEHYPDPGGAIIDSLKIVQKYQGWVSDVAISALAEHMNLPLANLESVATFYNLIFRQKVGTTLVHPCNGISCLLMGYKSVHQSLKQQLNIVDGQTCPKTDITLISLPCLGACDKAPVMFVRQSNLSTKAETDSLFENIKPEAIEGILSQLAEHQPQGESQP